MDANSNYERMLRNFKPELEPGLKQTIMNHYIRSRAEKRVAHWWNRPVPLYKAAAAAVLLAAISLFAGAQLSEKADRPITSPETVSQQTTPTYDLKPVITVNSQF